MFLFTHSENKETYVCGNMLILSTSSVLFHYQRLLLISKSMLIICTTYSVYWFQKVSLLLESLISFLNLSWKKKQSKHRPVFLLTSIHFEIPANGNQHITPSNSDLIFPMWITLLQDRKLEKKRFLFLFLQTEESKTEMYVCMYSYIRVYAFAVNWT